MKKAMFKLVAMVLMVSMFLCSAALAEYVYVREDCNVRLGPGLQYESVDVQPAGTCMEYWDEIAVDERGVVWYNVIYGNLSAWVSSRCCSLLEGYYYR